MKSRYKRALLLVIGLTLLAAASAFVMQALNSNIALYITPTEVAEGKAPMSQAFRIGGMVKDGSLKREGLVVHFVMTDFARVVPVSYRGILPDLFKQGQGAVVQGKFNPGGDFVATEVLAKHDENYMPPQAKAALEQSQKQPGGISKP